MILKDLVVPSVDGRNALEDSLFSAMRAGDSKMRDTAFRVSALAISVIRVVIGVVQFLLAPLEWVYKKETSRYLYERSFHVAMSNVTSFLEWLKLDFTTC